MLIQRLGSDTQMDEKFVDSLIEIIKKNKGCCDEVWLASKYGFPKIEIHRETASKLIEVAEKFRRADITVSLQISNTIGHGEYMSTRDCSGLVYEDSPVEKMVGADGTIANYCFCWNGENFRKYTIEEIKEYAKLKPHCLWFDDDLRASNHYPVANGCFCGHCMSLFNEMYDSNFTRETLVHEINHGDLEWREKYIDFIRKSLYDFTYVASSALHEISPESYAGFQYVCHGSYTGYGYEYIFDAIKDATGKNPKSRPGGGVYNDHNPNDFLMKLKSINWQNYMLPDYVSDKLPEIENLPDVVYGKSIPGTCFETSLYLAGGNTGMTYAMIMNDYEDMDWHNEMLKAFSSHRKYWTKLSEYNKNTVPAGLQLAMPKEMWKYSLKDDDVDFKWELESYDRGYELWGTGVPISCGGNKDSVRLLSYENAVRLSKDEIEDLLSQPVITDGAVLKYLNEMGYEFSATAEQVNTIQLFERYNNHPVNKGFSGRKWSQSIFYTTGYQIIDLDSKTEAFGIYDSNVANHRVHDNPDSPSIANAVVITEKQAKWAVFGHQVFSRTISYEKRTQIINAADYISNYRLPAYVLSKLQSIPIVRENTEGRVTSVSVVNSTIGAYDNLQVVIRRPFSEHFSYQSPGLEIKNLNFELNGDEYIVTVPVLEAWSIGTIFCDN